MIIRKYFFFIFLFYLLSCSKDNQELVDIDSFLKKGKEINYSKNSDILNIENSKINVLKILSRSQFFDWPENNFNSKNLINASNIEIFKEKKKISGNFQSLISYKGKLITINDNSEISIYDKNFKKIASKKIYKRKIYKNYQIKFSIAAHKDRIYVSNSLGSIFCITIKNLDIKWVKNLGVPFRSNIKIYKDKIYLVNSNSKVFSINIIDGTILWSFETASNNLKSKYAYQIAVYDDLLYFTNDSSELFCIDLIGKKILWSLTFENENFNQSPLIFKSSPIVIDGNNNLFISVNNGTTYSINSKSGIVNWVSNIYSLNKFSVTEKYIVMCSLSRIIILNKNNGKIVFNKKNNLTKSKKKFNFKDIIIGKNNIYLLDEKGFILSIKLKNLNITSIINSSKNYKDYIISNNKLFILSDNLISVY